MNKLDNVQYSNDMIISMKLIQEAVGNLECGKWAGPDGIFAESIKFAHHRIHVLLSLCFSLCLTHGYMPLDMIKTTIGHQQKLLYVGLKICFNVSRFYIYINERHVTLNVSGFILLLLITLVNVLIVYNRQRRPLSGTQRNRIKSNEHTEGHYYYV